VPAPATPAGRPACLPPGRPDLNHGRVRRELDYVRLAVNGKDFIARTALKGEAYWAFKAVGLRVSSQVVEL